MGGWSTSRPGRFTPGKVRYPLCRRLSGPQGRSGRVRKISPTPGFELRTFQPVAIPTTLSRPPLYKYILLLLHYNSCRILAFSTISHHLRQSWTCSAHYTSFIFLKSFLTSSSHGDLGLPTGLLVDDFHLYIFRKLLVSGIRFMCPNQLNLWDLT